MSNIQGAVPDRYPVSCPHCARMSGLPVAVMTVANNPGVLRLDLKCDACHHRWWLQFATRFTFAPPEPAHL